MIKYFAIPELDKPNDRPKYLFCELEPINVILCNDAVGFHFVAEFFADLMLSGDSPHWDWCGDRDDSVVSVVLNEVSTHHWEYTITETDSEPQKIVLVNLCTETTTELIEAIGAIKQAKSPRCVYFLNNNSHPEIGLESPIAFSEYKKYDELWNRGVDWVIRSGILMGRFSLDVRLESGESPDYNLIRETYKHG